MAHSKEMLHALIVGGLWLVACGLWLVSRIRWVDELLSSSATCKRDSGDGVDWESVREWQCAFWVGG